MLHDEIERVLKEMDVRATAETVERLETHARTLIEANTYLNLTRITAPNALARLHVADSVVALPWLDAAPAGPFADIGSGGGYPGIPLAVLSGRRLTLIESTAKKAAFLSSVVDSLGLDAEVLAQRAEEAAAARKGHFSAVTARAVAPLASLVELAAPLLASGGRFIALKARPEAEELDAGDRAAAVVGLRREETVEVALPGGDECRTIITYVRIGAPKVKLPRRTGLAQHSPLG